ncbi:hypothetical protein PV04_00954 [Phialophora macrospora]|uniref:Uncharacterized protein n=1 Tax=Phialophora macrospora TaxID=1851006 RepID=A0A0D2GK65_9EURO|nr:hypothetical protein PV04_00954 [Phialophora macrospora]
MAFWSSVVVLRSPGSGSGYVQHHGSKVYQVQILDSGIHKSLYEHVGFGPTNDTVGKDPVGGGVGVGSNTGIETSEGNARVTEPVQESSVHVPVERSADSVEEEFVEVNVSCDCDDEVEVASLVDVSLVVSERSVEEELMLLLSVAALETSEDTTDSLDEEDDSSTLAEVGVVEAEDEKLSDELDVLVSGAAELLESSELLSVGAVDVSALVSVGADTDSAVVDIDSAVVEPDNSVDGGKVFVSVTVKVLVTPVTSVTVDMGRLELVASDPGCVATLVSVTMTVLLASVTTVTGGSVTITVPTSVAENVAEAVDMNVAVALLVILQSSQGP